MSSKNLTINLKKDKDRHGRIYYIGKCEFPGNISFKDGVAFLIFVSEEGCEELQIAGIKDKNYSSDEK